MKLIELLDTIQANTLTYIEGLENQVTKAVSYSSPTDALSDVDVNNYVYIVKSVSLFESNHDVGIYIEVESIGELA